VIMDYENLIKLLNTLAQEYLFMDSKDMDIPMAGKFLNHLELIMDEAKKLKINTVKNCAASLSQILEKTILDAIEDKTAAANVFESGIHLMQDIADSFNNTGKYDGSIQEFLEKTSAVAGVASSTGTSENQPDKSIENLQQIEPDNTQGIQIQDESLTRDFIAEGLEYIEEIEINILNLENEPENKDYINAIFRPFHSIKGVASFLNLEKIRSLAHNL
jgi:two-component system chemotaxis sensor kinase CheA